MPVPVDTKLAERLIGQLNADTEPQNGRVGRVRRYLAGDHDMPYMPHGAKAEYRMMAERSITNWLPLVPETFAKGLFVDGYRSKGASSDSLAWAHWQANRMDARQGIAHRGALDHGASYVLVLPGKPSPVIRPMSPTRSLAWYLDDDDEFPEIGLRYRGRTAGDALLWEIFDNANVYTVAQSKDGGTYISAVDSHDLGVTPFVRFLDRLDGEAVGVVSPLIRLQDRINDIVFSTMMALQYASHRQRWATGLAIPTDEEGNAVEPLKAAVDRLWVSEDPETRFGDFAQTEVSGHISLYGETVKTLAARAQISPNIMTGDLVNLSAEALAQLESSTDRKRSELETLFGESWESTLRLACRAAGDVKGASDTSSQVRWRDTEARSLAQTVDALGKMAQMLQVPVPALWERIPGVTSQDIDRWVALRDGEDILGQVSREIARQTDASTAAAQVMNPAAA